tara:strand:+ start:43 stop:237 length:195 start_codon:yes stop_codon:yes gene_type:complete
MKVGDLILYTPDADSTEPPDVGIVLKLTPSGTKASVLWSTESLALYFAAGYLERYPNNFKLVSK